MRRIIAALATLAVASLAVASTATGDVVQHKKLPVVGVAASAAPSAAQAPGMAGLAGPYLGSYTATLSVEQAVSAGDARMAGRFTLVLKRNGTYSADNPLDPATHGRLAALSGKRLRFYADSGCELGGFERPRGGIYRWSLSGRRLTLRLVSEGPCTGRTQTLTYSVWTRK